jgi:glutathione S-transferase
VAGLLLYDNAASSNALKVRFLLAELGLEYERREVPLERPRPEWYLEVNPLGGVPALDDGDVRLAESNAILRYLARREGRADLYPATAREAVRVDWLLDVWSTAVRPVMGPFERAAGIFGSAEPDGVDASRDAAARVLGAVERVVADNGTMTGSFTIADCCAAPTLFRSRKLPLELERWPRLASVRETVTARAAFAAAGPVR